MRGHLNALLIPLILITLLLFGALGFGYWAYAGRQDYKDNVDEKIAAANQVEDQRITNTLNKQFAEKEKNPLTTYNGPEAFGSMAIKYPKTWSSYVAVNNQSSSAVDGYFYPGAVPDITNTSNSYALRVQVVSQSPSDLMQRYQGNVQAGTIKVRPYSLPMVPKVIGNYLTGQIQDQKQGQMVVLPVRNQTLLIWTESSAYQNDFNNIILKNFSFLP